MNTTGKGDLQQGWAQSIAANRATQAILITILGDLDRKYSSKYPLTWTEVMQRNRRCWLDIHTQWPAI